MRHSAVGLRRQHGIARAQQGVVVVRRKHQQAFVASLPFGEEGVDVVRAAAGAQVVIGKGVGIHSAPRGFVIAGLWHRLDGL
ncbi:MAG: hypothetical protein ACYCZF_08535 [Anaerolineae bacterium]